MSFYPRFGKVGQELVHGALILRSDLLSIELANAACSVVPLTVRPFMPAFDEGVAIQKQANWPIEKLQDIK